MMDVDIQNTGITAQLDLPPVLGSCENLQLWVRYSHMMPKLRTHLVTSGILASVHTLPLLGFANPMGGGRICDCKRDP
jgi:hypothetical protein